MKLNCSEDYDIKLEDRIPIAVLIDADNVEADHFENIFKEINNYGDPIIRRIYGDWSSDYLKKWKNISQNYALNQHQVSQNTKNKNSTDISLVIDAMDILYKKEIKCFCIISSDSDYTKLALRLKEESKYVIGFGNKDKTNKSLVNSCNKFVYYDTLNSKYNNDTLSEFYDAKKLREDKELINVLKTSINNLVNENNTVNMGTLKKNLIKLIPDFDTHNYGYKKFSDLIEAIDYWDLDESRKHLILSEKINDKNYKYAKLIKENNENFIIDKISNEKINVSKFENLKLNLEELSDDDEMVYEISKENKYHNLKFYGQIINYGIYGFIRTDKGDIFIPENTMLGIKKNKIKLNDYVGFYKKSSEKGKNSIAYAIEKIS